MNNHTPEDENQTLIQEEVEVFPATDDDQRVRDWLKIAEYIALGSAAIGSILAWLFEQVLFAATPLTVALALNLVSRVKLEENMEENIDLAIAEVYSSGDFFTSKIQELPGETTDFLPANSEEEEDEIPSITDEEWEENNGRFLRIEENLKSLQEAIAELQKRGEASTNKPVAELTSLQTNIAEIQQQVKKLQQQNREIVKPYLQRLNRSLKQLQSSLRPENKE